MAELTQEQPFRKRQDMGFGNPVRPRAAGPLESTGTNPSSNTVTAAYYTRGWRHLGTSLKEGPVNPNNCKLR